MRVCVISGVIKDSKVLQALSASFAQACEFYVCNAEWFTPVPGLGPELCHGRGLACLAFPRPWDCVSVTVALGVSSVMVSGLASKRTKTAAYLHQGSPHGLTASGPQDGNAGILVQHHEQTKHLEKSRGRK